MKKELSLSELNNYIRQLDEAIKDYENSLTVEELAELKAESKQKPIRPSGVKRATKTVSKKINQ